MKRHLVRLAVILAGVVGLVELFEVTANAGISMQHCEPLR